ncbi:uncharacterized protein LOC144752942 [Lissotriton helveticus]
MKPAAVMLLLPLLLCLSALPRPAPGAEPHRVRTPEGSPFFIPTMNLTDVWVVWGGTHTPDCRGAPIITVLYEEPWSFKPALGDRVRKRLSGGSIVIANATKRDEGFYTLCNSSFEPILVIELELTGWTFSHPVSLEQTRMSTASDAHRRRWPLVLAVLGSVSVLAAAAAAAVWKREPLKRLFTSGSSTGSDIESSTSQGSQEAAKKMNGETPV